MAETTTQADVEKIKARLIMIDKLLHQYDWLMTSYTTDYFSSGLEKKFPLSFVIALLKDCSLTDLASFIPNWESPDDNSKYLQLKQSNSLVLPLSMLALRTLCHSLCLDQQLHRDTLHTGAVFGTKMEKYFRVCVKEKKRHEIDQLSQVISSLCKQTSCDQVIDLGAGLGHLSRILTYNKSLRVTTIEATDSHSPKAQRLDQQTASLLSHKKPEGKKAIDERQPNKPNHISHWIDSSITTEQFIDLLSKDNSPSNPPATASAIVGQISNKMNNILCEARSSELSNLTRFDPTDAGRDSHALPRFELPWKNTPIPSSGCQLALNSSNLAQLLTNQIAAPRSSKTIQLPVCMPRGGMCLSGLHACGDLSSTLLKVFVKLDCAEVLSSVGCCYMKLSHDNDSLRPGNPTGFPMSGFVRKLPHYNGMCNYEALEMGCHFAAQYRRRLIDEEPSLRRHVVRAVLQTLLYRRKKKSELQFKRLKIKNSESMPFREYAEKAFTRMGLEFDVSDSEIEECEILISSHWRAVVGAYTMRLALAPLVEAYILLDRALYLHEQGIKSKLVPVFNPILSPRNMVLIASKKYQVQPTGSTN